jgi:hypothetical protein
MATYEGKWRCARCSTANLGRHLNCQTCGVKRAEDVEFFLEDEAQAISDAELLRQANAGADWICRYCGGNNRAFAAQCSSCGSVRTDEDKQLIEETRGVGDWSEAAQTAARNAARQQSFQQSFQQTQSKKSFFSSRLFKFALLGASGLAVIFVALFAGLLYIASLSYATEVEVTGLEWTRTVAAEEYKTVTETAWEGELPPDARVQSSERALHHTEKVADGTRSVPETYTEQVSDGTETYNCGRTSKKNGYFEDKTCTRTKYKSVTRTRNRTETVYKDVPVYRTRYNYQIEKWVTVDEKTTSGTDFNPQWAAVPTDKTHRAGKRTENYVLLCKELGGANKPHKIELTAENWSNFINGERLSGKKDIFGLLVELDKIGKITEK